MNDQSAESRKLAVHDENRSTDGRFTHGNAGRKPGSKNRQSLQAIKKLREMSDEAFEKLRENVSNGDQRAIEFVLSRILPSGRVLEIEATPAGVVAALEDGVLTGDEARHLTTALSKLAELEDLQSVKEKVEELEALLRNGGMH